MESDADADYTAGTTLSVGTASLFYPIYPKRSVCLWEYKHSDGFSQWGEETMKSVRTIAAVVAAWLLLCTAMAVGTPVAQVDASAVGGIRWFPCDPGRQNDPIWEVECVSEGCLCQGFTESPYETGNTNYLDTDYNPSGALTITRNGADGIDGMYWPRIRTLWLEDVPEWDLKTNNTLYFDIDADAEWNVYITFNGSLNIKIGRAMAAACGVTVSDGLGSDGDAPSGHYVGSLNLLDAMRAMADNPGDPCAVVANSVLNMKRYFVPQIQIFCVGQVGDSVTINKLFMTTPDDANGANTEHVDLGMIFGDEIYGAFEPEDPYEEPAEDPDDPIITGPTFRPTTTTRPQDKPDTTVTRPTTTSPTRPEEDAEEEKDTDKPKDDDDERDDRKTVPVPLYIVVLVGVVAGAFGLTAWLSRKLT